MSDSANSSSKSGKIPAILAVVAAAIVLLAATFPLGVWFVGASILHIFEQDYGRPDAPLNRAALGWNWKEFEVLVKDRSQRKDAGFPRLTAKLAAENGQNTLLALLIDKYGFDVNQRIYDHSPETALDFAIKNGRTETVEMLIRRGAKGSATARSQ